jgi:hypothetical protein
MALWLDSSSSAEVDMIAIIGIAIAGILFLLRVLFALLRDEWLQRESVAVVRAKLQSDEPQFTSANQSPKRFPFEVRLKNAALAANQAESAAKVHARGRAISL